MKFVFSEWLKLDFMVKSTVGKGVVKQLAFTIVKGTFIRQQFIYTSRNISWKILCNVRWIVRGYIDV